MDEQLKGFELAKAGTNDIFMSKDADVKGTRYTCVVQGISVQIEMYKAEAKYHPPGDGLLVKSFPDGSFIIVVCDGVSTKLGGDAYDLSGMDPDASDCVKAFIDEIVKMDSPAQLDATLTSAAELMKQQFPLSRTTVDVCTVQKREDAAGYTVTRKVVGREKDLGIFAVVDPDNKRVDGIGPSMQSAKGFFPQITEPNMCGTIMEVPSGSQIVITTDAYNPEGGDKVRQGITIADVQRNETLRDQIGDMRENKEDDGTCVRVDLS